MQDVKYYTRTVYGVSESFFGGLHEDHRHKPQGAGQGNGVAPQLWAVVSSKMFHILHELNLANVITTPIDGTDMHIISFAYVDDLDLFAWDPEDVDATMIKMQQIVEKWELVAKVTGRAIAPQKCWWYLVRFQWDKHGNWNYIQGNDNYSIYAKDADNVTHSMKYLSPGTAQEMLGVHIAPDGSNKAQVSFLKDRARYFADAIRTTNIFASEVWVALTTIAMKSIEYCLPATMLTKEECQEIMWILIEGFAPKSGINRFIKQDVLYATAKSQGLGLHNIYYTQGISHIVELTEQMWKQSVMGHFMQVSLDSLRLELGLNGNLLNKDYALLKRLLNPTYSWLCNTWEFMHSHDITTIIDATTIPLAREHDAPLMELFLQAKLPPAHLQTINKCRQFLQIFTLADMTTGCGTRITINAWHVKRDMRIEYHNYTWPCTPPPSSAMIKLWQQSLCQVLCPERERVLQQQLGKWIQCPKYWKWFVDSRGHLWSKTTTGKAQQHPLLSGLTRRKVFSMDTIPSTVVPMLHPTTVVENEHGLIPTGYNVFLNKRQITTTSIEDHSYQQWLHY